MRINTNVASLTAQEAATNTGKMLSNSLEKLSSGLRINKASDDASGMAIADKLRTQASSLGQSIANANSASSLIQIADKAMAEQSNILDIVKSKLIQATTDTTSAEGRAAIKNDVQKLLTQLDNITDQTNYNGLKLLDGSDFTFQVGELSTNTISANIAEASDTNSLGTKSLNLAAALTNTTGADTGTAQVDTVAITDGGNPWKAGDTATIEIHSVTSNDVFRYSYTVTDADINDDANTTVEDKVAASLLAEVNVDTAKHGITAAGNAAALTLTAGTANVRYENTVSTGKNLDGLKSLSGDLTRDISNDYMAVVDGALNELNLMRSEFGSTQNQIESSLRNMMTTKTNIKAAESVIRDVDYASESANFNKQNIIAQAGTYAQSQANAVSQNVLRLLQ